MLNSISPLDGRYAPKTEFLRQYFSEFALIKERVAVELKYLLALDKTQVFPKLQPPELEKINKLLANFTLGHAQQIKEIEKETNHDVKACEIFLRQHLQLTNSEAIHWGLTSEDVNNLAWSSLFMRYRTEAQVPMLLQVLKKLITMAENYSGKAFPARTHGQMATPTTAGKELAVYISRLTLCYQKLTSQVFVGKLNGATGNYSAMQIAAPNYNWIEFSNNFISSLQLVPNAATTQIENHDAWVEYFDLTKHINNIFCDLDLDFWQYLMLGYYSEKCINLEVGSSTMPHKINPIRFENSEGNICVSNALLHAFSEKLSKSRMQRDLSDSTVTRNVGVALTQAWLAWEQTLAGLDRVQLNEAHCLTELQQHPEIVAEAAQSILRLHNVSNAYDELKALSRGHDFNLAALERLGVKYNLNSESAQILTNLKPESYLGNAEKICITIVVKAKKELGL